MGSSYRLSIESVLGSMCFAGTGKPTGVYWHPDGSMFAVASTLRWSLWAGHGFTKRLRLTHRVAIYEAGTCKKLAALDAVDWPINEVTFHPHDSVVAIGAGEYDGGWCYEGALLVWDYQSGECYSVLSETREVTRCRFSSDGSSLYWLCRPATEEDEDGNDLSGSYYGFRAQGTADSCEALAMADTGFATAYARQSTPDVVAELQRLAAAAGKCYEPRWHTWDIAWIGDRELVSVGASPFIEHWDRDGQRLGIFRGDESLGVQVFWRPTQEIALVNRFARGPNGAMIPSRSSLLAYEPKANVLSTVLADRPACSLSMSASGHLLARDCSYATQENTSDCLIGTDLQPHAPVNLGRYDPYNHYIRLDGGDALYFLQGTPATSHQQQWLCRLNPVTGQVERLFSLEWDPGRGAHFHSDAGCLVSDSSVVMAVHQYHPHGFPLNGAMICRRQLTDGSLQWVHSFNSQVTAVAYLSAVKLIAFALTEGKVGLMDAGTGELLDLLDVQVDGVGSMVLSLAAQGDQLAASTIDGVVMILGVSESRS